MIGKKAQLLDPHLHKRFNGVVQTDEGPVEVQNGICVVQGVTYFVSDDGKYVVDKTGALVAIIKNGKVIAPTPEIVDQLKQSGVLQK